MDQPSLKFYNRTDINLPIHNGNKINPLQRVLRRGFYQTKNYAKVGLPLYIVYKVVKEEQKPRLTPR